MGERIGTLLKGQIMHRTYSALILDDDPDAQAFLHWFLDKHFPWLRVATGDQPQTAQGFDFYFIDNNFGGQAKAVPLVREIRATDPQAFIGVFSGHLTPETFKKLVNAGCDGACEKGKPADLALLGELIAGHLDQLAKQKTQQPKTGWRGVAEAMSGLIQSWNDRLDHPGVAGQNAA